MNRTGPGLAMDGGCDDLPIGRELLRVIEGTLWRGPGLLALHCTYLEHDRQEERLVIRVSRLLNALASPGRDLDDSIIQPLPSGLLFCCSRHVASG